jgi:hypothetical protein
VNERAREPTASLAATAATDRGAERWFYLSFADADGWRGGCYVRAGSAEAAVNRAHRLGIHPGGDVVRNIAIEDELLDKIVPAGDRERLLNAGEVEGALRRRRAP